MGTSKPARETDASVVFRRLAEGSALRGYEDARNGEPPEPDAVLASLLDLNGTVRVADHLAVRRNAPATPARAAVPSPVRKRLAKKVDEILDETRSAFDAPWTGRRSMPGPDVVARVLAESGALESREEAAIASVAATLTSQARERWDHQLARSRQRLRWLRTDVANELRALSPRAAEVEGFDAVLSRSLETGYAKLLMRLDQKLDDVFAARVRAAIRALPEGESSLDGWFRPGGVMHRHARDLASLLAILIDHEVEILHSLADAAWALRNEDVST